MLPAGWLKGLTSGDGGLLGCRVSRGTRSTGLSPSLSASDPLRRVSAGVFALACLGLRFGGLSRDTAPICSVTTSVCCTASTAFPLLEATLETRTEVFLAVVLPLRCTSGSVSSEPKSSTGLQSSSPAYFMGTFFFAGPPRSVKDESESTGRGSQPSSPAARTVIFSRSDSPALKEKRFFWMVSGGFSELEMGEVS